MKCPLVLYCVWNNRSSRDRWYDFKSEAYMTKPWTRGINVYY